MQDADVAFMRDMAAYMRVDDTANDGMHGPIRHMVWWDWNPNSGDTGGLVNDGWTVVRDSCDMLYINAKCMCLTSITAQPSIGHIKLALAGRYLS
jgi:hypothetical protein